MLAVEAYLITLIPIYSGTMPYWLCTGYNTSHNVITVLFQETGSLMATHDYSLKATLYSCPPSELWEALLNTGAIQVAKDNVL